MPKKNKICVDILYLIVYNGNNGKGDFSKKYIGCKKPKKTIDKLYHIV